MFYYLNGTVAHIEPYLVVIDCGGVGYACRTTNFTQASLKKGEKGKVFTFLNVREDVMELYGFASLEERNLFQQLISVSGVGPKAALGILSSSTPANLALSIITGDERALTAAQGVGKKIAQRIILELKDKLAKGQSIGGGGMESYGGTGVTIIPENKLSEASAALAVLGYSQGEINLALKGVDLDSHTLEDIIKLALKKMMKN
ncbi:MAG: Holliday junction branch migration protein RuvA [Oscillospiraceae bacterium]|jgi:Holliday junction DNA helicase RuvA|nr:Holliday junction branch migration protein RuvA [Oscillospiraceae bacterium]MCI9393877.1 Holliday junction branch migration protein RuvA [Oscillospiraceae bacterium]MCI9580935.1 Holliday junction branch migration protein RuvA [Oscillospiraceae bacterium]